MLNRALLLVPIFLAWDASSSAADLCDGSESASYHTCLLVRTEEAANSVNGSARQLLSEYDSLVESQRAKRAGATTLRYSGAAVSGLELPGANGTASVLVGPAKTLIAEGLSHASEALYESARESIEKDLIYLLDEKLDGELIGPDGRLMAARFNDAARLLNDPELYSGLADEHRDALRFAQGRLTLDYLEALRQSMVLADTQREVIRRDVLTLTGSVEEIAKTANALSRTAVRTERLVAATRRDTSRLLTIASRDAQLIAGLASAQLPARMQLELARKGVMAITSEQERALEDRIFAEHVQYVARGAADSLRSFASLVNDQNLARALSDVSAVLEEGGALAGSMAIGADPFAIGSGVLRFVGVVGRLGRRSQETPEMAIMRQIAILARTLAGYHEQEMEAIGAVNANVNRLRVELREQIQILRDDLLAVSFSQFGEQRQVVAACAELASAYRAAVLRNEAATVSAFRNFWESEPDYASLLSECRNGMVEVLQRDVGLLFSSFDVAPSGVTLSAEGNSLRRVRTEILSPMRRFAQDVPDAAGRDQFLLAYQVPYSSIVQGIRGDTAGYENPPRGSRLAFMGDGERILSSSTVLAFSEDARTILQWAPLMKPNGVPLSLGELRTCISPTQPGPVCPANRPILEVDLLLRLRNVLRWTIAQEQLIAGLPALSEAVLQLEEVLAPAYHKARTSAEGLEALAMLVASRATRNVDNEDDCTKDAPSTIWRLLCLMDANPYFADNVILQFVTNRLAARGPLAMIEYAIALERDTSQALQSVLGEDVSLDGFSVRATDGRRQAVWVLMLPRHFYRKLESEAADLSSMSSSERVLADCWSRGPVALIDPSDRTESLRAERLVDVEWGRCFQLPPAELIARGAVSARSDIDAMKEELNALDALISELTQFSATAFE